MYEYEHAHVVVVLLLSLVHSLQPMDCSPPGSFVHGILQQEYRSGLPCPLPGDLPDPGIEPLSPTLQADYLPSETPGKHGEIILERDDEAPKLEQWFQIYLV